MKKEIKECDIGDMTHRGNIETIKVDVVFDHDQEDGRSKCEPYLDRVEIEICEGCKKHMLVHRRLIYAYGAMGYNKYYLSPNSSY